MWLTFDDIQTRHGWRPFVAQLIDAPGVHSIHVLYDREGEIQAASVNRDEAMKAAMVGALAGAAATGMASGKEKETAMAAATAAAQAFMVAYGLGQEFTLEKGTKLETRSRATSSRRSDVRLSIDAKTSPVWRAVNR